MRYHFQTCNCHTHASHIILWWGIVCDVSDRFFSSRKHSYVIFEMGCHLWNEARVPFWNGYHFDVGYHLWWERSFFVSNTTLMCDYWNGVSFVKWGDIVKWGLILKWGIICDMRDRFFSVIQHSYVKFLKWGIICEMRSHFEIMSHSEMWYHLWSDEF